MTNQQQLVNSVIAARAKEIIEFVEMDMPVEWAIEYVRNSTTLSAQSMEKVVELVSEEIREAK